MNVLFILGNGFDKAQGLKTSYQDFYKEYQKLDAASELEANLKKSIKSDYETWADMEEGLGLYSSQFTDVFKFREVLSIINTRLRDYLNAQFLRIDSLGLSRDKLIKGFKNPECELEPKQKSSFNDYYLRLNPKAINIQCVTFNYTKTLEVILGDKDASLGFRENRNDPVFFRSLLHLHGTLEDMILVGVNDVSQIANVSFREDPYLIEEFVKPEINNGCENMKNEMFRQLIGETDLIVLFGVSVGITDSIWWQTIGQRLDNPRDSLRVIYYPLDTSKDIENHQSSKLRLSKEKIAYLKERMDIKTSVDDLRERIYVGINKPFFKLK